MVSDFKMCLFPSYRTIQDKYTKLHKLVKTTCGRCPECLGKKRQDWYFRLQIELQNSLSCYFLTLTYNDEHLPKCLDDKPCFSVDDVQKFLKRLRKFYTGSKIKYFLIGEYGGNFGRPHYHSIMFNLPKKDIYTLNNEISQIWKNGYTSLANITDARIGYCCKYCLQNLQSKRTAAHPSLFPPFLVSRNPAIGSSYLTDSNIVYHLNNKTFNTNFCGKNFILPRYLREKIFGDYTDIKDEITQEFIKKEKEFYDEISKSPHGYNDFCKTNLQSARHTIQRFIQYQKGRFAKTELPDHLTYILNQKI